MIPRRVQLSAVTLLCLVASGTAHAEPCRAGAPGIPNFYKKPNGVFYIGKDEAGILETRRFLAHRPEANFSTQSGPLLVIDGRHPFGPLST